MKTINIKCDGCENDLIVNIRHPVYRLKLTSIDTAINNGGPTLDVLILDPLKEDKHFCNFKCLKKWIEKKSDLSF